MPKERMTMDGTWKAAAGPGYVTVNSKGDGVHWTLDTAAPDQGTPEGDIGPRRDRSFEIAAGETFYLKGDAWTLVDIFRETDPS